MKILILTNLYPLPWEPNRATFNKQQFTRLAELHDVRIIVPVAWRDYWRNHKELKEKNSTRLRYVCYWYTPKLLYRFFGLYMYLSVWFSSRRWILSDTVDTVLASWAYPDGYAGLRVAQNLNCPFFVKVHGSDINVLTDQPMQKQQIAMVCDQAQGIITVSDALKQKVIQLGVAAAKVVRIYNGVDHSLFYPLEQPQQQLYFLFVGNLKQDKGVLDLLKAYARYVHDGGKAQLVYVGSGPMEPSLRKFIIAANLEPQVKLVGALEHEHTANYIRRCAVLILPSYHEGVPNVLLEAAACGVPVIATRVGGIPEVVDEGRTGILIEPGDIAALSNAMEQLSSSNHWNRDAILNQGQKFSWEKNLTALTAVLKESEGKRYISQ